MINVPLPDLIKQFKAEIGADLAQGVAADETFGELLTRKQEWYAAKFRWPLLHRQWDVSVGGRYVDFPEQDTLGESWKLDVDYPFNVKVKDGSIWRPLEYGITADDYNIYDPDDNETSSPVAKYMYHTINDGNDYRFEFWPSPSEVQACRIWGRRQLRPLSKGCDIDNLLLVYTCAGEFLAAMEKPNAMIKMQLAQDRLNTLRGNNPSVGQTVVFGRDCEDRDQRKVVHIATA